MEEGEGNVGEWIVDLGGRENGTWKTEHREWNEKKGE
jgi:hypothetical protein